MEHPYKFIDDAFRELFNRFQIYDEKDTDFNVTFFKRINPRQHLKSESFCRWNRPSNNYNSFKFVYLSDSATTSWSEHASVVETLLL
jgi:hypothetical protein